MSNLFNVQMNRPKSHVTAPQTPVNSDPVIATTAMTHADKIARTEDNVVTSPEMSDCFDFFNVTKSMADIVSNTIEPFTFYNQHVDREIYTQLGSCVVATEILECTGLSERLLKVSTEVEKFASDNNIDTSALLYFVDAFTDFNNFRFRSMTHGQLTDTIIGNVENGVLTITAATPKVQG